MSKIHIVVAIAAIAVLTGCNSIQAPQWELLGQNGHTQAQVEEMRDEVVPQLAEMGMDMPAPEDVAIVIAPHGELPMGEVDHLNREIEPEAAVDSCNGPVVVKPGWTARRVIAAEFIKIGRCRAGEKLATIRIPYDTTLREWIRKYE